jgi:hypothetical protein
MDKETQEMMDYLTSKDRNLWDFQNLFNDEQESKVLLAMFPEPFFTMLKVLINKIVAAYDFHDTFEEAHNDFRQDVKGLEAKLRNHRHELNKNFSGKAEF